MSIKQVHICDGCGKMLEEAKDIYRLYLPTNTFWDGIETTYLEERLEFCRDCARNIKNALEKIAKREADGDE
ncbi:hypothetical protein PQ692_00300 [Thermoanaerobacterium thermosaccharolyticum]|uniref:hypothetical protein n=1 Tax=Thermoanaerobacterium thermosaccharolyticum TaxID=1517 RepID=UPI003DA9F11E